MTQQERELKFEIAPSDVAGLGTRPLLRHAEGSARKHLRSVYFDTPDDDIWKAGGVLRVRHEGGRKVQGIKSRGGASAAMQRDEEEHEIASDYPDITEPYDTFLARILKKRRIRKQLAPRFEIDVTRRVWMIRLNSAEIEVALDRGKIVSDGAASQLCELELELKRGEVASLYQVARQLGADVPLRFNLVSKGELGYRLVQGIWEQPQRAGAINLHRRMPASEALQTIGAECLKHFLLNERLLRDANEAEPVHQARIAIRRLRAALTFFKPLVEDERSLSLKRELKWISDLLGEVRDLDVFQSDVIEQSYAQQWVVGLDELAAEVKSRREGAYERLRTALDGVRFREWLLDFAEWLDVGDWHSTPEHDAQSQRDEKIEVFAARKLGQRRRKLLKRAVHLDELDDRTRHRVRIAAKKLRYMVEFFRALFTAHKAQRDEFRRGLEDLQTILGDLNDRLAGRRLLVSLVAEAPRRKRLGDGAAMASAADELGRRLTLADKSKSLRRALKTARKLDDSAPFWR